MVFHVQIDVKVPYGADPERVKQLGAQEHARAK